MAGEKTMSNIPTIMALYHRHMISEKEVIAWADEQLLNESEPFDYIVELSLKGPDFCSNLPEREFPPAREFSFIEEFALRTKNLNVEAIDEKNDFLNWVSTECMGEDLEIPEVSFGYHIDHYFFECEDLSFANKYLKEQLAILIPKNAQVAEKIWSAIGIS